MNKNDSDDDDDEINNNYERKMILDMSEQCEYKMQIINKKKNRRGRIHFTQTKIIVI